MGLLSVSKLRKQLAAKGALIQSLRKQIDNKDRTIATLRQHLASARSANQHHAALRYPRTSSH